MRVASRVCLFSADYDGGGKKIYAFWKAEYFCYKQRWYPRNTYTAAVCLKWRLRIKWIKRRSTLEKNGRIIQSAKQLTSFLMAALFMCFTIQNTSTSHSFTRIIHFLFISFLRALFHLHSSTLLCFNRFNSLLSSTHLQQLFLSQIYFIFFILCCAEMMSFG